MCDKLGSIPSLPGVGEVTIAFACPEQCADASKNWTCTPGTTCDTSEQLEVPSPAKTFASELQLLRQGQGRQRAETTYGAVLLSTNPSIGTSATVIYNTSSRNAVPVFLNVVANSLRLALTGQGPEIEVKNAPVPLAAHEDINQLRDALVNLTSTLVIIIAFSWIPAAVVTYVVREQEAHHNSKHQQLISGVSILTFWTSNLLWELCLYSVPLGLSILSIYVFDIDVFTENGALWATFVTFTGYGVAVMPFSYLLSLMFSKHTSAQVFCLVISFSLDSSS